MNYREKGDTNKEREAAYNLGIRDGQKDGQRDAQYAKKWGDYDICRADAIVGKIKVTCNLHNFVCKKHEEIYEKAYRDAYASQF